MTDNTILRCPRCGSSNIKDTIVDGKVVKKTCRYCNAIVARNHMVVR